MDSLTPFEEARRALKSHDAPPLGPISASIDARHLRATLAEVDRLTAERDVLRTRVAALHQEQRWRNAETETPPTWDLIEVRWWRTERYAEFARYCPDMERPWRKAGLDEMQPPTHWRPLGAGPSES